MKGKCAVIALMTWKNSDSISIGTKLDALAQAVESNTDPTECIQTFIKDQLRDLRIEMLRFDEVVSKGRKAQESNNALNQQLEAEQRHTQQLTEQIGVLRQNEEDLKARQAQIERQLADIHGKAEDRDVDPTALEQETSELRQRLSTIEHELNDKEAEISRLERKLGKRDRKLADYEVSPDD